MILTSDVDEIKSYVFSSDATSEPQSVLSTDPSNCYTLNGGIIIKEKVNAQPHDWVGYEVIVDGEKYYGISERGGMTIGWRAPM